MLSKLLKLVSDMFEVSLQGLGSHPKLFILCERTPKDTQQPLGFRD